MRSLRIRVLAILAVAAASVLFIVACGGSGSGSGGSGSDIGLGDLLGGGVSSKAVAVSADGSAVVGESASAEGSEAFRWTAADGMVGLGDLPSGGFYSKALGVSADGSVVVGNSSSKSDRQAFRWTAAGGMTSLGGFAGVDIRSDAMATSDDGSVVVGHGDSLEGRQAFRWENTGTCTLDNSGAEPCMVGLGDLARGGFSSRATAVSADGSVVVGRGTINRNWPGAFHWTEATGMVGIRDCPGNGVDIEANGVSSDGLVVVGRCKSLSGNEAFRFEQTATCSLLNAQPDPCVLGLGDLTGGDFFSYATATSADGSVVVGWGSTTSGKEAFRWEHTATCSLANTGSDPCLVRLADYLTARGFDVSAWTLTEATGISADGSVIVGNGVNPDGDAEAWLVEIP